MKLILAPTKTVRPIADILRPVQLQALVVVVMEQRVVPVLRFVINTDWSNLVSPYTGRNFP